jgi:hypothetical protein
MDWEAIFEVVFEEKDSCESLTFEAQIIPSRTGKEPKPTY